MHPARLDRLRATFPHESPVRSRLDASARGAVVGVGDNGMIEVDWTKPYKARGYHLEDEIEPLTPPAPRAQRRLLSSMDDAFAGVRRFLPSCDDDRADALPTMTR